MTERMHANGKGEKVHDGGEIIHPNISKKKTRKKRKKYSIVDDLEYAIESAYGQMNIETPFARYFLSLSSLAFI